VLIGVHICIMVVSDAEFVQGITHPKSPAASREIVIHQAKIQGGGFSRGSAFSCPASSLILISNSVGMMSVLMGYSVGVPVLPLVTTAARTCLKVIIEKEHDVLAAHPILSEGCVCSTAPRINPILGRLRCAAVVDYGYSAETVLAIRHVGQDLAGSLEAIPDYTKLGVSGIESH
jgi:hypothetical protein